MGLAYKSGVTAQNTKANGSTTKSLERENLPMLMGTFTMVIFWTQSLTVMVFIKNQMEIYTKVTG